MIRRFAKPYAKAFMEITSTPQAAAPVHAELNRFESLRAGNPELSGALANPGVEADQKRAIVRTIGERMGLTDLAIRILDVLVGNHRINDLGAILEAWQAIINQESGVVVALVRTAHDLDGNEKASLQRTLEQKTGRTVELQLKTDSSLLGGFVARIGSEIYDASVTGRIERLRRSIS